LHAWLLLMHTPHASTSSLCCQLLLQQLLLLLLCPAPARLRCTHKHHVHQQHSVAWCYLVCFYVYKACKKQGDFITTVAGQSIAHNHAV
jgi:hypothetical protein